MFIKDHDLDGIVKIGYVTATCGLTSALYLLGMNEWLIWLKFHLVDILLCVSICIIIYCQAPSPNPKSQILKSKDLDFGWQ